MNIKIAWRNIWRSPVRSFVVMGSVLVGVWAIIVLLGFTNGMVSSYINNAIKNQVSHIQIHQPEFKEDLEVKYMLKDADTMVEKIAQNADVQSVTPRAMVNVMLSTSSGVRGVMARGVLPESEAKVTALDKKIIEGEYFTEKGRNQVLISKRLADKLGLKLRKKVVLQFQDLNGEITAAAFRIKGIYKTGNNIFDEANIFVKRSDIAPHLGQEKATHEIAIYLNDPKTLDATTAALKADYPNDLVETYREISPDVKLYETNIDVSSALFTTIFMLALIFGIINTMLMAVLERTKELGMLMAVGMNKLKVFGMIVLETIMLGSIGAPIGLFLGWLTVSYFNSAGIDLSSYSSATEAYGFSSIIYPVADSGIYLQLMLSVVFTAILASIYPAFKATRLRPVEAMRKI